MSNTWRACGQDQTAIRPACERCNGLLNLVGITKANDVYVYSDGRCCGLNDGELSDPARSIGIATDCNAAQMRRDLLEQLQPFPGERILEPCKSSGIAARLCQTFDEAGAHRIGDVVEDDRNIGLQSHQGRHRGIAGDDDDIRRERDQLLCEPTNLHRIVFGPVEIDLYLVPTRHRQFVHYLYEGCSRASEFRFVLPY